MVLRREGVVLPLGRRSLDILIYLAERPGEIGAKRELWDRAWPGTTMEEASLQVHMAVIRKALGERGNRYISSIDGVAYSFLGSVVQIEFVARAEAANVHGGTGLPRGRTELGCALVPSQA
jgi:DNA-binding winged helix-turn-helix (wHTH) protein